MRVELAGCVVDCDRRTVVRPDGETLKLTPREAALLAYLAERPGQDISRETLLVEVWGYAPSVVSRASDNAVRRLRTKVERDPDDPEHLLTVHGLGYRFEPLVHRTATAAPAPSRGVLFFEGFEVDLDRMRVIRPDGGQSLTAVEADLLAHLAPRGVVPRDELMSVGWGRGASRRAFDSAIARLRTKLGSDVLVSVRTQGYRLEGLRYAEPDDPDFVGRRAVGDRLRSAVLEGKPLIVLLGPGGIGKSTLARRVFPEALWVDLVGATDDQGVLLALCSALGLEPRGSPNRLVALIARVIASHDVVVLDNCEQVADAVVDRLDVLLGDGRTLVATSRVRLGHPDELPLVVERLDSESAAALYLRRSEQACGGKAPRFDREAVDELVDALDGIPLAIELAAARAPILPPRALLSRLNLDILRRKGGRHETMREAIRGSWTLLEPGQQRALAVLSRLPAGFDLATAERVLGIDALEDVQGVCDASLMYTEADGRVKAFVPVREYALDEPIDVADQIALVEAFAHYGDRELLHYRGKRANLATWRALRRDAANVAACIPMAIDVAPERAALLGLAAATVYTTHGPSAIASDLLTTIEPLTPVERRSHLLSLRALIWMIEGRFHEAIEAYEEGIESAGQGSIDRAVHLAGLASARGAVASPDRESTYIRAAEAAEAAGMLGRAALCRARVIMHDEQRIDEAIAHCEAGLAAAIEAEDVRMTGMLSTQIGKLCWYVDRWQLAIRHLNRAVGDVRELGDAVGEGQSSSTLCQVLLAYGALDDLETEVPLGAAAWRRVGNAEGEALLYAMAGSARVIRGTHDEAVEAFEEARRVHGSKRSMMMCWVDALEGRMLLAQRDFQSARALLERAVEGLDNARLPALVGAARLALTRAWIGVGDLDRAEAVLEQALPAMAQAAHSERTEVFTSRGWLALARGDRASAETHLEEAREQARKTGLHLPTSPMIYQISMLREALDAPSSS